MGVVVTGGSGFIGPHIMERFPDAINLDIKEGNDILECDLPPADLVIHLAAEPGVVRSVEDPYSNARTNILGTIRLAKHYKDAQFIFASSGGTIQKEIESPYGLSKHTCEEYIKLLHGNANILRFPNVYGEGSRSVVDKWLNEDEMTIYGDGNTFRIFGHVSDVANAVQKAIDLKAGTYFLGTQQRYKVLDIARRVSELTDKPVRFAPAREGEITHPNSSLDNTIPDWKPEVELMSYIREQIDGQCNNPK